MHWILDKKLSWVVSSTFSSTCKILLSPSAGSHTPMKHTLIPYLQWVCPAFESHLRVALGNRRELNKASLRWALPISFATLTIIWGAQKHFWKLLIFDNFFLHNWETAADRSKMKRTRCMLRRVWTLSRDLYFWFLSSDQATVTPFSYALRTQDSETSMIHISLWESPSITPQRDMHIWLFVCKIVKNLVGKSHSSCFLSNHKTNTVAHH